jgi:hypothetical protein
MLRFIASSALALLLPLPSPAQVVPNAGDRVRVRVEDTWVMGNVMDLGPDSIRVSLGGAGAQRTFPLSSVSQVEVSAGRRRHFARNFVIAVATTSALTSVLVGMSWDGPPDERQRGSDYFCLCARSRGEAYAGGALLGAVIGLPVGILVGLTRTEAWEEAALHPPRETWLQVSPFVDDEVEGLRVSVTIR